MVCFLLININKNLEEDVIDYVSSLLVKYVVSVCEGGDLSDDFVEGNIEESVEAQKLVEYDCNQVYTSRLSLALKNLILSKMSLYSFGDFVGEKLFVDLDFNDGTGDLLITSDSNQDDLIYSQTDVSMFLKVKVCRLVLEFISDLPLKSNQNLKNKKNYENNNNENSDESYENNSKNNNSNFDQHNQLYVGINYKTHGIMVLRRFTVLCTSVCPLKNELHIQFLKGHLSHTGPSKRINLGYLNCSRPWIVYWTLHSLAILGEDLSPYRERSINTLMSCWDPVHGGFGGGEGQVGHLATTYSALCVLKMLDSLEVVDSDKLYSFLMDMKMYNGSFSATYGGECDTRSTYCAVASAHIMGLLSDEFTEKIPEFIQSCQTYEGGLSAEPYLEAHAGFTYCGLSALAILEEMERIDLDKLYHWAIRRLTSQLGFQGRPHKLVDSCYSFWIGGCLEIINNYSDQLFQCNIKNKKDSNTDSGFENNFNSESKSDSGYNCMLSCSNNDNNDKNNKKTNKYDENDGSCENSQGDPNDRNSSDSDSLNSQNSRYDPSLIYNQNVMNVTRNKSGNRLYEQLLRCYLLVVSQTGKGFRDKPNKPSDLYHTCYSLSYLNIINPITDRKHNILLNVIEF